MRLLTLSLLFGAAAVAVATPEEEDIDDAAPQSTVFNGKTVPPMLELTPDNWEKESKASRFLMVKHYSPYCPHCIDFAPTFQTLYEFYYTSNPAGNTPKDIDFTNFYDFRFGDLNCVAYNDLCTAHKVASWPSTILYENGEPIVSFRGTKGISILSGAVEDALEKAKPGTRPATLELPEPGDKESPKPNSKQTDTAAPEQVTETTAQEAAAAVTTAEVQATGKPAPIAYKAPPQKILTPKSTPNPDGALVPLTAKTFQTQVTLTKDPWMVKFYAPWCHHCKAMAPSWEQLAKQMKGRLNIGEVNCDIETKLCKDMRIRGFPSILFFSGGERVEYDGLRGLGDFLQYAEKALDAANGVQDVDAESFKALEQKEEVIFLYFYDHATTTEDFMAMDRLVLSLIGHAKLVKTQDPALYDLFKITTWPRLVASREGRPTYYTPLAPREMRDSRLLFSWMKSVWLPLVPELTASNARDIMDGKIVVLGILNREDQESFQSAIREMKSAANEWLDKQAQLFQLERQELRDGKQLRIEEAQDRDDERALRNAKNIRINMSRSDRKEVTFAWVDGAFWNRWIRTTYGIDTTVGERVIINDEDNRRYWDQTSTGNPIVPSRTSILETINKVTANPPKIRPKYTLSMISKFFFDIKTTFKEHPFLSTGCVIGIAFGCVSWFRGRIRRTRGGHFKLEDAKAPFFGGGGGHDGKAD